MLCMVTYPFFKNISHIFCFDGILGLAGHLSICSEFLSHYHAFAVQNDSAWLIPRPGMETSYHALEAYLVDTHEGEIKCIGMRHSVA